jgi:hypothetical protein
MAKYKLNIKRDVEVFDDDNYLFTLPYGFRFYDDIVHTKGFDSIREIKYAIWNGEVVPCDCDDCVANLNN